MSTNKPVKAPYMRKPCAECPYRKDSMKGWLGKYRADELVNDTDSFTCHKTKDSDKQGLKQCAGHMLLLGNENAFVRILKAQGEKVNLKGRTLVFDNKQDFIDHHEW